MKFFKTSGVISASTGVLLGPLDDVYAVGSYLLGRPMFTHEIVYYSSRVSSALAAAITGLPTHADAEHITRENYKSELAKWEAKFGSELSKKSLLDHANDIESGGVRCNCDLDNWKPERSTGHSHVCRIHKIAELEASVTDVNAR